MSRNMLIVVSVVAVLWAMLIAPPTTAPDPVPPGAAAARTSRCLVIVPAFNEREAIGRAMRDASICGLGQTAPELYDIGIDWVIGADAGRAEDRHTGAFHLHRLEALEELQENPHCALQIGGHVCGNHFGDIVAHFEDIGNAVGAQPASRAQIRINPYLHRKLLTYDVLYGERVI